MAPLIPLGAHGLREHGVPSVRADDDARALGDRPTAPCVTWAPATRPSSNKSSTVKPSRSSAPAATASTTNASSTVRRGAYAQAAPSAAQGPGDGHRAEVERRYLEIEGQADASSAPSRPHRASAATRADG